MRRAILFITLVGSGDSIGRGLQRHSECGCELDYLENGGFLMSDEQRQSLLSSETIERILKESNAAISKLIESRKVDPESLRIPVTDFTKRNKT